MGASLETQEMPTPAKIFDMLLAHERTSALRAAIQLGVFEAVGEGIHDRKEIAARCTASERGIRILCDYLTIEGLLSKEGTSYSLTPVSAMFLDPKSPACVAPIARFLGDPMLIRPFENLAEIVRSGRTSLPGDGSVEAENPAWVEFAHSMAPMMAPMAGPLGSIVLEGMTGELRVLDIAAGHGLFGIAVARQDPQARIVGQDWASVLEVAKANAQKAGVGDRYETLPGSAFDVEFGGPYDIALLTNFLHHFDIPTCVSILKKVRAALKPGGKAAALEFVPNEDRVSPPLPAAFALTMLATTPSGDAYTFRDLEGMYQEAGYQSIIAYPVPRGPHTVVIGHTP